jgi:hypothetical protein
MTAEREGLAAWLKKNPEPDVRELVEKFGGWSRVPVEAWREFDRQMADWKARYRRRHGSEESKGLTGV